MYRVVLIDDENIIVEGLRRVIKWADYGCEVVGTASGAEEGAALIRKLQPHILFTDIRMPGADGLTMLAALRSEFPDMQVTVLTGYQDFSYAQQAIRLGVTRFLLKPSKMDEIKEALVTMTTRLDAQSQLRHQEEEPEEEHEPDVPKLHLNGEEGAWFNGYSDRVRRCEVSQLEDLNRAMAYIEEHYAEKLTLQSVADCCYVSQWHLSKLLNRHTGQSFYDILNTVRIRKAKELLLDPRLKIGEIGEQVGYADTAHFARTFKKQVGISPRGYRKLRNPTETDGEDNTDDVL